MDGAAVREVLLRCDKSNKTVVSGESFLYLISGINKIMCHGANASKEVFMKDWQGAERVSWRINSVRKIKQKQKEWRDKDKHAFMMKVMVKLHTA